MRCSEGSGGRSFQTPACIKTSGEPRFLDPSPEVELRGLVWAAWESPPQMMSHHILTNSSLFDPSNSVMMWGEVGTLRTR